MSEITFHKPDYIDTSSLLRKALQLLGLWLRNYRTRKQLKSISADGLKDVGISVAQAREESAKHFWQ
ncbi:DUF1127 domain-containing protein [Vibrio sp. S4M6]|nr:DUF1127 domain-containing protein [Vibrio sinus]MCL9784004.1 DUF1127 domain-containing protein [Vibrio sinus]